MDAPVALVRELVGAGDHVARPAAPVGTLAQWSRARVKRSRTQHAVEWREVRAQTVRLRRLLNTPNCVVSLAGMDRQKSGPG